MKKSIYLIITSLCLNFSFAQVFDVQYQTLNFGANKVNKIGNGQSDGNKVLFQNVITVNINYLLYWISYWNKLNPAIINRILEHIRQHIMNDNII